MPLDSQLVKQINVEIDGLKTVASGIRNELENGFRSQVPQVNDAMQPGATIGGQIAGAEWIRLQDIYSQSIQATVDALFNLDLGTQAVAQAADIIARDYGDSDAFAHAQAADVQSVLAPAPSESLAPLQSTISAEARNA
jgi:hypothetical protein